MPENPEEFNVLSGLNFHLELINSVGELTSGSIVYEDWSEVSIL